METIHFNKKCFVEDLNKVIANVVGEVTNVRYEVYLNPKVNFYNEFVIVTYRGDAYSALSVTGDSNSAIFSAIAAVCDNRDDSTNAFYQHIAETQPKSEGVS